MIYPEDKDQFIAAATRAWGMHPPGRKDHTPGDSLSPYEAKRYYVVEDVTFSEDKTGEDDERHFGRGQGTHRAYLLYRLMRSDNAQLVEALKEVRLALLHSKPKREALAAIKAALTGRE